MSANFLHCPVLYKHISSKDNAQFKQLRQLLTTHKARKNAELTVIEGVHLIDSLVKKQATKKIQNIVIKQVWVAESAQTNPEVADLIDQVHTLHADAIHYMSIPDDMYRQISNLGTGIDILAVITMPQTHVSPLADNLHNQDCLVLNDVQDIGNVGTLLRTAAAVGVKNIVCTSGTANIWSPKCLRASMGAHFSLTIYENIALQDITNIQVQTFATSSHTENTIYNQNLSKPTCWIMGNEGQGVCNELMQQAIPITIPQPHGEESLNVAIAGALCMYEMLRQRQYC